MLVLWLIQAIKISVHKKAFLDQKSLKSIAFIADTFQSQWQQMNSTACSSLTNPSP
jgi:hypothetical protein